MDDLNKFERVAFEDDPERCQATGTHGQCMYRRIRNKNGILTNYCPRHSGRGQVSRNYNFAAQFQATIGAFAESKSLKSVAEEIGLMRMMVQTIVNRCENELDLILEADRIAKLVSEINKLVISCHKMEEATGQVLSKNIVVNIAGMMINILAKHVPDKAVLDQVGNEIYEAIASSASGEAENGTVTN